MCVVNLASVCVCLQTRVLDPLIESTKLADMSYEKTIPTYKKCLSDLLGMSSLIYGLSNKNVSVGSKRFDDHR